MSVFLGLMFWCWIICRANPLSFVVPTFRRLQYVRAVLNDSAALPDGWMAPLSAYTVALVGRAQHALGIFGSVGEIGVHHGLFFIALAHTALLGERLFACDVFDKQYLNVDKSGAGDSARFNRNLVFFGIDPAAVWIFSHSSSAISSSQLWDAALLPFRLLSIDGSHTAEAVLSDLLLASQIIAPGGVVIVDDFTEPLFMEVREGVYRFFCPLLKRNGSTCVRRRPTLAPFLLLCNKLYMTTPSHHHMLLNIVRNDPWSPVAVAPDQTAYGSTRIGGWRVAVQEERRHYHLRCGPWEISQPAQLDVWRHFGRAWRRLTVHPVKAPVSDTP